MLLNIDRSVIGQHHCGFCVTIVHSIYIYFTSSEFQLQRKLIGAKPLSVTCANGDLKKGYKQRNRQN